MKETFGLEYVRFTSSPHFLGGGFKHFLLSPRNLGKISTLTTVTFFKWVVRPPTRLCLKINFLDFYQVYFETGYIYLVFYQVYFLNNFHKKRFFSPGLLIICARSPWFGVFFRRVIRALLVHLFRTIIATACISPALIFINTVTGVHAKVLFFCKGRKRRDG